MAQLIIPSYNKKPTVGMRRWVPERVIKGILVGLFLPYVLLGGEVFVMSVDGVINPVSARFIINAVDRAEKAKAEALIIELDTPGGLFEPTRDIVQKFLGADVPIVVYVSPDGARAGSAGVFITLAAHIAAMAPGSNIGAAHPVTIGGGGLPGGGVDTSNTRVMTDKITNDAAALVRSIAQTRGRNAEWAEKAVRESAAITAIDAVKYGVVDLLAPNLDSLLTVLDQREVRLKNSVHKLSTRGVAITRLEMTWRERFFNQLSDPNLAYIFMLIGIYGILFELYNPGAVVPGVVGVLSLLLAFFAFQALPVNVVGILLILFGIILLLLEIKVTSYGALTVGGALSLFLGSLMLFDTSVPSMRVSLGIILPAVVFTVLFFLFAVGMGLKAQARKPTIGHEALLGMEGVTLEDLKPTGKIMVNGEYWNAECSPEVSGGIPAGTKVVVKEVKGMTLVVAPILS